MSNNSYPEHELSYHTVHLELSTDNFLFHYSKIKPSASSVIISNHYNKGYLIFEIPQNDNQHIHTADA